MGGVRRYVCAAAALSLVGGSLGLAGWLGVGAGVAGATNNTPAGNPTSPAVSYEADCSTSLSAGDIAPLISSTVVNTTVTSGSASGTTFGVSGRVSQTVIGQIIAGVEQELNSPAWRSTRRSARPTARPSAPPPTPTRSHR
jgi:hypothetical protein